MLLMPLLVLALQSLIEVVALLLQALRREIAHLVNALMIPLTKGLDLLLTALAQRRREAMRLLIRAIQHVVSKSLRAVHVSDLLRVLPLQRAVAELAHAILLAMELLMGDRLLVRPDVGRCERLLARPLARLKQPDVRARGSRILRRRSRLPSLLHALDGVTHEAWLQRPTLFLIAIPRFNARSHRACQEDGNERACHQLLWTIPHGVLLHFKFNNVINTKYTP